MIGYANNFDFARSEACIGIWQHYTDQPKDQMHISAPVSKLMRDGDVRADMCSKSIDNLIPWLVGHMHPIGVVFSMQKIGLMRVALLSVLVGWLLWAAPSLRPPVALSFFLVFGDIAYLSYFNTLYNETSVLIGAFISIWAIVGLISGERRCLMPAFAGLAFLGMSKVQYAPLAVVLGIIALALLRDSRGTVILGFSLVIFGAFNMASGPDIGLRHSTKIANNTDTYLGAALPAASNKIDALRILRLPDNCLNAIGLTFYSPGVIDKHPCPDVVSVSRARLIPLFATQPSTLFRPIIGFSEKSKPIYLNYMGHYETPAMSNSRIYNIAVATSATTYLDKLPARAFGALMLFVAFVSMMSILFRRTPESYAFAISGMTILYTIASGVFGDGYFEAAKHGLLIGFGFFIQISCILLYKASARS